MKVPVLPDVQDDPLKMKVSETPENLLTPLTLNILKKLS